MNADNKEIKVSKKHKKENNKEKEKVELTNEEVIAMNKKLTEAEERYLRCQADLINYRKRKDEETEKLLKFANEDLILDILPALDNFERALNLESSDSSLQDGMKMIYKSLVNTLNKYDVKEIECLGKVFDPKLCNAVMTDSKDDKEKEVVLEVYQKGYTLKDKVIRPAMVKVNK